MLSKTACHALSTVWTLCLCYFIFSADETTVMMSREVNTRQSGFAYFIKEKFSRLNITALVKRVTGNSLSCAFSCLNNLACFSFNFAAFPDEAGKFSWEILSSDKYNNSKDFLPSKNFHHFIIVVSNFTGIRSIESCGMIHVMIDCQLWIITHHCQAAMSAHVIMCEIIILMFFAHIGSFMESWYDAMCISTS